MRKPRKSHITRYGEGSFKYNPERDLWVGRYDTGQLTPRRTRLYITVSARDEDTAWQKFTAAISNRKGKKNRIITRLGQR